MFTPRNHSSCKLWVTCSLFFQFWPFGPQMRAATSTLSPKADSLSSGLQRLLLEPRHLPWMGTSRQGHQYFLQKLTFSLSAAVRQTGRSHGKISNQDLALGAWFSHTRPIRGGWYLVISVLVWNTDSSFCFEGASTSSSLRGPVGKCQCLTMAASKCLHLSSVMQKCKCCCLHHPLPAFSGFSSSSRVHLWARPKLYWSH